MLRRCILRPVWERLPAARFSGSSDAPEREGRVKPFVRGTVADRCRMGFRTHVWQDPAPAGEGWLKIARPARGPVIKERMPQR
ncbi:MAG: hypothetical protein AMXMBFR83_25720 [Phycisphaerae bacterium]